MSDGFVFGPRIKSVEDDAFLAGGDKVFGFGDGLTGDPILAFGGADMFAEFGLALGGNFDAAFFHFFINHAAKVDFGRAAFG